MIDMVPTMSTLLSTRRKFIKGERKSREREKKKKKDGKRMAETQSQEPRVLGIRKYISGKLAVRLQKAWVSFRA